MNTSLIIILGSLALLGMVFGFLFSRQPLRKGTSGTHFPTGELPTDADVKTLAKEGQKIIAIKLYRRIHQVGLKEAKDAVEQMASSPSSSS